MPGPPGGTRHGGCDGPRRSGHRRRVRGRHRRRAIGQQAAARSPSPGAAELLGWLCVGGSTTKSLATGLLIMALTVAALALAVPGLSLTSPSGPPVPSSSGETDDLARTQIALLAQIATEPVVIQWPTQTPTATRAPSNTPNPTTKPVTCSDLVKPGEVCMVRFFPPTRTPQPTATALRPCSTVAAYVATREANTVAYVGEAERMCRWDVTPTPTMGANRDQ